MAGEHEGHRARMRERFIKQGLDGFAAHEVLELLLFYAIPQRNVNPLAHTLLERFGSLHAVLDAPIEELRKTEGVGEYAATLLHLFSAVSTRLSQSRAGERVMLKNRRAAQEYCVRLLTGRKQEHLYAVCLNGQMQVIADALIARGSLSEVPAYPRVVADAVLRHNAHSVILCHNHPGGNAYPSQDDMDMTAKLAMLLKSIEVVLIDHMIVADGEAFSMSGQGLIRQEICENDILVKVASSAGELRIRSQLDK
ncbi:MAG: DNA repair protein RadC [Eubacteriales bacterium]|nr:DNA repair protein RadC [Eubacteriales bacterium]